MKMSKIIVASLIFVMIFMTVTQAGNIESIVGEAEFKEVDKGVASEILGFMQWIGYAIAVGMLIYIGIKYVTSAADERANLKGSLVKYVIGAVLIAGAVTLTNIMFNLGKTNTEEPVQDNVPSIFKYSEKTGTLE